MAHADWTWVDWSIVLWSNVSRFTLSKRWSGFLTPLNGNLTKNGYLDNLRNSVIPSAHLLGFGDNLIFQDDSAPCHNAKVVKHWKSDQDMRCLEWLPQSPELNPIENVWRDLGEAVRSAICHNLNELHQALVIEWSQIPVRRFQRPTEYGQL